MSIIIARVPYHNAHVFSSEDEGSILPRNSVMQPIY